MIAATRFISLACLVGLILAVTGVRAYSSELPSSAAAESLVTPFPNPDPPTGAIGEVGGNSPASSNVNSLREAPAWTKPANRVDQFGLGIQTEKNLKLGEPLQRSDCSDEDECAEYSGQAKPGSTRRGLKHLRKPFFGLSISKPLPW